MVFIFPKNYNFKSKLLGVIEYSTLFINIIWDIFIFCFLNLIFKSFSLKIMLFIIFCFPLFLFSIIGNCQESLINYIKYLFKFLLSTRLYLFDK